MLCLVKRRCSRLNKQPTTKNNAKFSLVFRSHIEKMALLWKREDGTEL